MMRIFLLLMIELATGTGKIKKDIEIDAINQNSVIIQIPQFWREVELTQLMAFKGKQAVR